VPVISINPNIEKTGKNIFQNFAGCNLCLFEGNTYAWDSGAAICEEEEELEEELDRDAILPVTTAVLDYSITENYMYDDSLITIRQPR